MSIQEAIEYMGLMAAGLGDGLRKEFVMKSAKTALAALKTMEWIEQNIWLTKSNVLAKFKEFGGKL